MRGERTIKKLVDMYFMVYPTDGLDNCIHIESVRVLGKQQDRNDV